MSSAGQFIHPRTHRIDVSIKAMTGADDDEEKSR
jgi:hypothetical protein